MESKHTKWPPTASPNSKFIFRVVTVALLTWRALYQIQTFFPIKKNIPLNKRMILSLLSLPFLFSLLFISSFSYFSSKNKATLSQSLEERKTKDNFTHKLRKREKKYQNLSNFCNACILLLRSESKDFLSQKKFWRQRSLSSSSQSKHTTILFS